MPFGRRQLVGILLASKQHSDVDTGKLKSALQILDTEPVLAGDLLQLLDWAAGYYHHPIGETLATALPVLLRKPGMTAGGNLKVWQLTEAGHQQLERGLGRAARQIAVLEQLRKHPQGLARENLSVPLAVLKNLQHKGWIARLDATHEPAHQLLTATQARHTLTDPQENAVNAVQAAFDRFSPFLLEGVTGSGKTEVYLQLIQPPVSYTHLTLPTNVQQCRSRWSPCH